MKEEVVGTEEEGVGITGNKVEEMRGGAGTEERGDERKSYGSDSNELRESSTSTGVL